MARHCSDTEGSRRLLRAHSPLIITNQDTRVDEGGRALLAPHWQDWDGGSEEQDEYDSRVLKEHIDSFMELHVSDGSMHALQLRP